MHLLDIELTIDREDGNHRFEVTISTYRVETSVKFTLSDSDRILLREFESQMDSAGGTTLDAAKELGTKLFEFVFRGEILAQWRSTYVEATQYDAQHHIRLTLNLTTRDSEDLLYWPWELLYDKDRERFLVLDPNVTLLRRIGGPIPHPRVTERPVRVLGVVAEPRNTPPLENIRAERDALAHAVDTLAGQVELTWLAPATPKALVEALRDNDYDVLHYIGHAAQTEDGGVLVLEDEYGNAVQVTGSDLSVRAGPQPLSLVVLNACQTGAPNVQRSFESLALSIMREMGVPIVVANRFPVGDRAASLFAESFYGTLLAGVSVERAMATARDKMAQTERPDWISPMLLTYLKEPLTLGLEPPKTLLDRFISVSPTFFASLLGLITALTTITVVATWRQLGPAVATILQLSVWVIALWFAYDSREKIRERLDYIVIAIAAGVIAAGIWFLWTPTIEITEPPRALEFQIVEPPEAFRPDEARAVRLTTPVRGTISGMPADHTLWLLLRVDNGTRYTPLVRADVRPDGTFEANEVFIGPVARRELDNRVYHIQPVLADAEADAQLELWSQNVLVFFHPDVRLTPEPRLDDALVVRR